MLTRQCAVLLETAAQQRLRLSLVLLPVVFFGDHVFSTVHFLGARHRGSGLGKCELTGFAKGGLKSVAPALQLSNGKQDGVMPERCRYESLP